MSYLKYVSSFLIGFVVGAGVALMRSRHRR